MQYRAIIKQTDGWWIGWLVDLPGVNAQEKSREELMESLRIGAQEMLETNIPFDETDSGFAAENHELRAFTEHSIMNISDWQKKEEDKIWI